MPSKKAKAKAAKAAKAAAKVAAGGPVARHRAVAERVVAVNPDDSRECWVCLEDADADGIATAPTGCACRGSAGHAHLSCLVATAQHAADYDARHLAWHSCPTCKQEYTTPMSVRLGRTRWGLYRGRPEGDMERGDALGHLATALQNTRGPTETAEAQPLLEERLAGLRRSHGDKAEQTLMSMINVATARVSLGEHAAALPLLEEALPACRVQEEKCYARYACQRFKGSTKS